LRSEKNFLDKKFLHHVMNDLFGDKKGAARERKRKIGARRSSGEVTA
jgi:hypothetical protein